MSDQDIRDTDPVNAFPPTLAVIRSLQMFENCTHSELKLLRSVLRFRMFESGDLICTQGEVGGSAFFLVEGEVQVYRHHPSLGRLNFSPLKPPALFGQVSLMDGFPRLATCEARLPSTALELTALAYRRLIIERTPASVILRKELARGLVRQIRGTNHQLALLESLPEDVDPEALHRVLGTLGNS